LNLFDSHCHLTAGAFEQDLEPVLARARAEGVTELVTIASDPGDAERALGLARETAGLWSSAGLHPHEAGQFDDSTIAELRRLSAEPEVVAIGEAGLDFHYDNAPRERQLECFKAQLSLAAELDLPIVVHSRDADAETAALLRDATGVRGVLHCFTGGPELLDAGLEAGWMVSFSGIVSFRRFDGVDLVRRVPDDRLLIETDSPYLAPVPNRGRRNEPSLLPLICAAVAGIRDQALETIADVTWRNARAFYGLD
jgi:TatD DNase family protein